MNYFMVTTQSFSLAGSDISLFGRIAIGVALRTGSHLVTNGDGFFGNGELGGSPTIQAPFVAFAVSFSGNGADPAGLLPGLLVT